MNNKIYNVNYKLDYQVRFLTIFKGGFYMKFLRFLAIVLSLTLISGGATFLPASSASATTDTILLGDVTDGDGVTAIDALLVQRYLRGEVTATPRQLTAMDVNEDGVIDNTDVSTIMYQIVMGNFSYVTKELYTVPDNSSVTYYKHNCSSTNSTQYTQYTIQSTSNYPASTNDLSSSNLSELRSVDYPDYQNIECVKVTCSSVQGSGFVVDNHLIMTAAHCVYGNSSFFSNVAVTFYDENMNPSTPISARYIHVPENFALTGNVNYDYALIYVDEDLSDYVVNIGVMTDYFMTTGQNLTTSGFTMYNIMQRCTGSITTMASYPLEISYRFHSNGKCKSGKSGGMVYFESTSSPSSTYTINYKSVVGNATHTSGEDTFGCRITTSLLRFIYQNSYLN